MTEAQQKVSSFLQKVTQPKNKRNKATLEEVIQLLSFANQIQRITDRGIFILLISKTYSKLLDTFQSDLRSFKLQLCPIPKPERRPRAFNDERPRRKRRHRRRDQEEQIDIEQIAQRSLDHPSNIEIRPQQRQNVGGLDQLSEEHSKQGSKDDSKSSKFNGSRTGQIEEGVFEQVISQLQRFPQNNNMQEFIGEDRSQPSSMTNGSSEGIIPKLKGKWEFLGGNESFERQKTRRHPGRGGRNVGSTIPTRRKADISIIDDQIFDNPTILEFNESTSMIDKEQNKLIQFLKKQQPLKLGRYDIKSSINMFKGFLKSQNMQQNIKRAKNIKGERQVPHDIMEVTYDDFPERQVDNSNIYKSIATNDIEEQLKINMFGNNEKKTTCRDLCKKMNKPKGRMFLKLLEMEQKGEVVLSQSHPQTFGEIYVERIIEA